MKAKKVLVVDDEKRYCELFDDFLSKRGYRVDLAYDGLEAKHLLKDNKYDYIFFDCNMPGFSGIDLYNVIKEKNPQAKKIMISGYDLINEDFTKFLAIDAFLSKPISLDDIKKTLT